MALYFVKVWPSTSQCTFFNICLPGPRALRDSRWLPSFNLTLMFGECHDKVVAVQR